MKKRVIISAGESSGDLHASNLVKELKKFSPDIEFIGIGCDRLEKEGVKLITRMDKHAIIGVWEIVENLSFIKGLFAGFENIIKKEKIDLAILVDYPGFNLALAGIIKKHKVPCVYYIAPQVWAWGGWRIRKMKSLIKKILVILKFEEEIYKKAGMDVSFVGHPLMDEKPAITDKASARDMIGLDKGAFTVALLPGSRPLEVKKLLPVMIESAKLIRNKREDIQFIISKSPNVDISYYEAVTAGTGIGISEKNIYTILSAADFVITASGTVTLQIAMAGKPMVITYITSWMTYILAKIFVKIPYIGLVNVLSRKFIVPELVQHKCTSKNIASTALGIMSSPEKMNNMRSDLGKVRLSLGEPGASLRAAEIIQREL